MITLKNITKTFDTDSGQFSALRNINLNVNKGDIFGIIGKSGAGKSTLIRCVNLLEKPTSGEVFVADQNLTELSPSALRIVRRKIGMIFQHFNLLSSRTVFENIALPLQFSGISSKKITQRISTLLELTGLTNKSKAYPNQLSGGQKQRVAIARALACEPHVLLSDEATSALDPETTQMILSLLKDIRDSLNITILLITHEMSVIKYCCDRVAILEQGEIVEENTIGEFFIHPQTETAKKFVISALSQPLPPAIRENLLNAETEQTHPVWELSFLEKTTTQPVITQLITQFNLKVNILQANVEYIQQNAMGRLVIAVYGDKEKLEVAKNYLKKLTIKIEVLGYVPNDIIAFG